MKEIHATPLTEEAFVPYGGLIAKGLTIPPVVASKLAPSKRSVEVVNPESLYDHAPSGKPSKPVVNVSVANPRPGLDGPKGSRSMVVDLMERHPYTTQIFVPMSRDAEFLVMVAENSKDDRPDMSTLKVFTASEGQGICYKTKMWHAPMTVVGTSTVTFAVFQSTNGVADEDCEFFSPAEEDKVKIHF